MSKKFWRNLTIFIICLLASCILLEVSIRVFLPQKIEPNYYSPAFGIPNALRPNTNVKINKRGPFPTHQIVINEKYIRSNTPTSYQKPPKEFRILCLGDSVFFGPGVQFNELFSYQLEKLLNTNSKETNFKVINASVPAWGPLEYFVYLKNEGHKYSPDLIIISNFPDDFRQNFSKKISFQDIQWEKTPDGSIKINLIGMQISLFRDTIINTLLTKIIQTDWYATLSKTSHLLNLIHLRMKALMDQELPSDSSQNKSLENFLRTSSIKLHPKIIWSYESKDLKINPQYQPALFFAKQSKKDVIQAETNVILYNVLIQNLLRLASKTADKTLILKIPSFFESVGLSQPKHPKWVFNQTDTTQYLDLFKPFFNFQNSHSPFLFFHFDNHWTPGGHLFFAKLLTRYINNKKPFHLINQLQKQPIAWPPQTHQSVKKVNSRVIEFLKNNNYQLLLNGIRQKNQNLFEEAEKTLTQYIQFEKEQYEVYFHLAMVQFKLNHYQKALDLLVEAQKGHVLEIPKYRRAYKFIKNYWEGKKKLRLGQLEKALAFFLKAEEIEKEKELLNNELASIYNQLKDFTKAEFYYKKEIEKRPDWVPSYLNLGSLYLANEHYKKALEQYQKALKLNPNFFGTYTLLGGVYFMIGEKETALEMGQKALRMNPSDIFTKSQIKKWSKGFQVQKN
jgi:tetratricopeptide (TPR) repeat protein